MERTPVESLRKGLDILELLCGAGTEGMSLAEIAARMGLKGNTAHNLLKTLCLCGYAENPEKGRYRYGSRVASLVRLVTAASPLPARLTAEIGRLSAAWNESVVLTTLAGGRRRVLLRAQGNQAVQVNCRLLETDAGYLWKTPTGRVLAAFCGLREREELLAAEGLPGSLWDGIDTPEKLETALAEIRRQGLAEQHTRDVASAAVPVVGSAGDLLGAVGMYMPGYRWNATVRRQIAETLRAAAPRLAEAWGTANGTTESGE